MLQKLNIKKKVILVVLGVSLLSLLLFSIVTFFGMISMKNNTQTANTQLGTSAANDSMAAMEKQTILQLTSLAQDKAVISDEKMGKLKKYVEMMASYATDLYANPSDYANMPIDYPNPKNKDILTPQLMIAKDLNVNQAKNEINLASNMQAILTPIQLADEEIAAAAAYFGTESGILIMSDKFSHVNAKYFDCRTRGWYQAAKQQGELVFTDVYDDAMGRGLAITCAMPVYDNQNQLKGVAGIGALLTDFNDVIIHTEIGESGYAFILNEQGQMIISPTIERDESGKIVRQSLLENENQEIRDIAQKMIHKESGVTRVNFNGKDVYMAFEPLQTLPWSIATVIDVEEALSPAQESKTNIMNMTNQALDGINQSILTMMILFIIVLAASLGLVIWASISLSKRLTKPISQLTQGVNKMRRGNIEFELEIKTGDEIEVLANTFNQMTKELKQYIINLATVTADKERIATELNVATKIQSSMLPCIFPAFPERKEFDIYATMTPAKEVGGDFYDFFLIDEYTLGVVMADVSGKGVPAALFMVIAKTLIKNQAQLGISAAQVFDAANDQLCENNEEGMFVTAFLGIYDMRTHQFTYVNAGHNPPLIYRKGKNFDWLNTQAGFVLAGMEGLKYEQQQTILNPGDMIFFYTDGITEAVNRENSLFSDDRLKGVLNQMDVERITLDGMIENVKDEIDQFANGADQADDITMLVLKINESGEV